MQQLPPLQNGYTPPQRRKRNPVVWWVNGGIACIILVVIGVPTFFPPRIPAKLG